MGGLHASLLSGTEGKLAAPVRQLLRACLRSEVSACRAIVDASSVEWVSQDNCIVPAMPVISTIQSPTVRERREKMMVGPMFAGYKCASAAWAACEKLRVGLCGVGKKGLWDRFQVKVLICVEHEAVEFARQVSSGPAHELRSVKCLKGWAVSLENQVCDACCVVVGYEHHRHEIAVSNLCGGLRVVNWDEVSYLCKPLDAHVSLGDVPRDCFEMVQSSYRKAMTELLLLPPLLSLIHI